MVKEHFYIKMGTNKNGEFHGQGTIYIKMEINTLGNIKMTKSMAKVLIHFLMELHMLVSMPMVKVLIPGLVNGKDKNM